MEDLILKSWINVSGKLDGDGEVEIWNNENDTGIWLDVCEVEKLVNHLTKVLVNEKEEVT